MLTLEAFTKYIEALRALDNTHETLRKVGIDIMPLLETVDRITSPLAIRVFTPEQKDTLDWWLYDGPKSIERDPTNPHQWEADGTPIPLSTVEELWTYLKGLESNESN